MSVKFKCLQVSETKQGLKKIPSDFGRTKQVKERMFSINWDFGEQNNNQFTVL